MISDRFKAAFTSLVMQLTARYDYSGVHGYTVTAQNSDFTLELQPDDPSADPPLSAVPIKYDGPDRRATVQKGATCNVMYTNKDPSRPFAFGFDPGAYELIELGTDGRKIATVGSLVQSGGATCYANLTPIIPVALVTPSGPGTWASGVPGYFKIGFISSAGIPSPSDFTGSGKLTGVVITGCTKAKAK